VDLYAKIRHAVMVDGLSRREAAKRFGVHRNTITKMLSFSVPPGYRRRERPASKKLGPYMAWIDAILEGDRRVHKKQRHTAHRIFERLRDERGFTGGYTIVRKSRPAPRMSVFGPKSMNVRSWRFSEIARSRGELQTRAMRQLVPDRFSRPLHLWPNGGATAGTLRPALFQRHSRTNVPALASARRPGSRCAFHRCHA
jgi:transposase